MNSNNYLTFNLHDVCYGIAAPLVKEIFLLPELTPIAEAPIDIVGILNLRGKTVPIMHLDLRLGNPMQTCKISDSVIVLEWQELQIGLIVNSVHEVRSIEPYQIEKQIDYGRQRNINPAFIAGVAQIDEQTIILLNSEALVRQPDAVEALIEAEETSEELTELDAEKTTLIQGGEADSFDTLIEEGGQKNSKIISSFYQLCCPDATPEERVIFRRRADNLRAGTTVAISDVTGQVPTAVVGINGEYFGIDLDSVREFINIRNFTPIPCCPKHIVGNMNLRGEIVTLVDIRGTLNLAMSPVKIGGKAVIIAVDEIVAGLPVDEVFDVMYLNSSEISSIPVAIDTNNQEYLRGTAPYGDKMASLIDLPKLLTKGDLVVDQEV